MTVWTRKANKGQTGRQVGQMLFAVAVVVLEMIAGDFVSHRHISTLLRHHASGRIRERMSSILRPISMP